MSKPFQVSLAPEKLWQAINPWSFYQQGAQFGRVEVREQPVRHFQPYRVGHRWVLERAAFEAAEDRLLGRCRRRRGEAAAGVRFGDGGVAAALQQQ